METPSGDCPSSILNLPDDTLHLIFQKLVYGSDRKSFGLTCRRWLHIQNSSRRSLHFSCSFTHLSLTSLSQTTASINSYHLHRLLNRFQHLETLSLSGCTELPDSGLTQLQHHGSKMQTLYFDCCFGITDVGFSLVAEGCPSLTSISLYRCNITDIGLTSLAKSLTGLKDVDLSYCSLVSDQGIKSLSENCSQLRAVRISHCRSINGIGFKGCSNTLVYVEADSCKLKPEGISGIVSGGGLEYLNVSSLIWSTNGDGLTTTGIGFASRLKILDLRLCRSVGDESIIAIANGCAVLQEWNLALCHGVRVLGWESIGLKCNNLERLHVNRCRNLCDRGLQALRDGCKKLSVLYISHTHRTTSAGLEMFKCLRGDVEIREEEVMCIAPKWAFCNAVYDR